MRSKLLIALAVGFGSLILLIGILGFGVVQRVRQMSDQMEAAQRAYIQAEDLLGDISGDLQMVGILVRDYLLDPSSATAPEYRAQLIRQRNLIESRLQLLSTREFHAAEKLRKEVKAYLDSLDPLLAWTLQEKAAFGSAFMRHEVIPRRNAVVELSRQLNGLNLESLRTAELDVLAERVAAETVIASEPLVHDGDEGRSVAVAVGERTPCDQALAVGLEEFRRDLVAKRTAS